MRSLGPVAHQIQSNRSSPLSHPIRYCRARGYFGLREACQVTLSHQLSILLDPLRIAVLTCETIPSEE